MKTSTKMRSLFLLGGVTAMMGITMMVPQAAHADKAKNYKYGAAALGVLGAILVAKGKTIPGVLAGAGAYYAYKKGDKIQEQEKNRYPYYRRDKDRYDSRYDNRYNDRYDDRYDNRYDNRDDYRYDNRYDDSDRNRNYHYNDHSYRVR